MKISTLTGGLMVCLAASITAMPHSISEGSDLAVGALTARGHATIDEKKCPKAVAIKLPTGNKRMKNLDKCKPMPPHTCIRDALVALALYREVCKGINLLDAQCWLRAPSIERCCGEWVKYSDEDSKWIDAPTYHERETSFYVRDAETGKPIKIFNGPEMCKDEDGDNAKRLAIKPSWGDFNTNVRGCRTWRPADEQSYWAMMQNLPDYELTDADLHAQVVSEVLGKTQVIGYMP